MRNLAFWLIETDTTQKYSSKKILKTADDRQTFLLKTDLQNYTDSPRFTCQPVAEEAPSYERIWSESRATQKFQITTEKKSH